MHHGEGEHSTQRARDPTMRGPAAGPAPPEGFEWGYDSSEPDSVRADTDAAGPPPEFDDFERECFGDEDGCDLWSRRASVSHAVERFSSVEGGFRTVL